MKIVPVLLMLMTTAAVGAMNDFVSVVPCPEKIERSDGLFQLTAFTRIVVNAEGASTAAFVAEKMRVPTGYPLTIQSNVVGGIGGAITFSTNGADAKLGKEGYRLEVNTNGVVIIANSDAGWFYGAETLLQLLPPEIFSTKPVSNIAWQIPCGYIEDKPRFAWRGFMLDVSRHFFGKAEIKRVLDLMAMHKLNTFHWHLTDDQGWRIQISEYPKLTEVGAWRAKSDIRAPREAADNLERDNAHPSWAQPPSDAFDSSGRYGGFYTPEDIREIVQYAAMRHITVVPEIEMPGHAVAALAAYPELSCDHGRYSTDVGSGINNGVFCVGNDRVLKFLDDVLLEVMPLFPGPYIHIGGDEVNAAVKKATWGKCASCQARIKSLGLQGEDGLQSWFVRQMEQFVRSHRKILVGWSEIVEGGLASNAVVMDWRGGAMQAATNGQDVVMSPTRFCYLDYYQSLDREREPHAFGGFLPLEKVYGLEPIPVELPARFQNHILGAQGNLWTESIASLKHLEYMTFPRLCAIAEAAWSPKDERDWTDFSQRLQTHCRRLAELEVNYHRDTSFQVGMWRPAKLATNAAGTDLTWDVSAQIKERGEYRVAFEFDHGIGLTISSVSLWAGNAEVAADEHSGFAGHRSNRPVYVLQLPSVVPGATYTLCAHVIGLNSSGRVWIDHLREN